MLSHPTSTATDILEDAKPVSMPELGVGPAPLEAEPIGVRSPSTTSPLVASISIQPSAERHISAQVCGLYDPGAVFGGNT